MNPSEQFFKHVKNGENVLLTGPGGTGKTWHFRKMIEENPHNFVLTSTTGISALNLHELARTIHSVSGIGKKTIKDFPNRAKIRDYIEHYMPPELVDSIIGMKSLLIDEISMKHPDQFDLVDVFLREIRGIEFPFGGVQLVIGGDFLQLPPVDKELQDQVDDRKADASGRVEFKRTPNKWCFDSDAWKAANIKVVQLTEIKRTDEIEFAQLLCRVRNMTWTAKDFKLLKSTEFHTYPEGIKPIKLFNSNKKADAENAIQINALEGTKIQVKFKARGDWNKILELKKGILAPDVLELKPNCRLMILINKSSLDHLNDDDENYVNGSLGTFICMKEMWTVREVWIHDRDPVTFEVTNIRKDRKKYHVLVIKLDSGPTVYIKRHVWESGEHFINQFGKPQAEVEFSQYPVRLAYGFTIHKCQGMSIDNVEIDASGIRTDNQFYVAVSRARTFKGLRILNLKASNITACPRALEFYQNSL